MNHEHQPIIPPSFDEFGNQRKIIPAEVKGRFRKRRDWTQIVLLIIFLLAPWIKIRGEQALLFDIPNRKFHFFGFHFFSHDAPLIFLIFVILVFGIIFMTAVWGRVFCGWVCPQTIFIDGVFRRIEILIEGKYLKRRKDAQTPMTWDKFSRKVIKWTLFTLVSSVIAHSALAFFAGSEKLIEMMSRNPAQNWSYFVLITTITSIILFDFAIFREQFCLIVCPYGRFQSVLLGKHSLNVGYDEKRGEPRKGSTTGSSKAGDCVSCNRCVEVCPTGIDIRQGLQMECIACTACIDACDEIMVKVKKPTGLIRYMNSLGESKWTLKSSRALFSLGIVSLAILVLVMSVSTRAQIDLIVLRAKDSLFQELEVKGLPTLINHFKIHVKNQSRHPLKLLITGDLTGGPLDISTAENPFILKENEDRELHIFVKFPKSSATSGQRPAKIILYNQETQSPLSEANIHLIGPLK